MHVLEARMDESVHVLMLTGAGEKFFCAGGGHRDARKVRALLQVQRSAVTMRRSRVRSNEEERQKVP
jgi:enoyl-CoA hydratase/carnithine racemase